MNTPTDPNLLDLFKTLGDAERLKIAGLLANEPLSLTELSQRLELPLNDVSNHLAHLEAQGLLQKEGDAYRLAAKALEQKARAVLAQSHPKVKSDDFEGDDYDRKILSSYIAVDGSLKSIPTQHKKLMVILHHIVKQFQPGIRYPEKQVNEILRRFHEDYAALRRYLVDNRLMAREKGEYWTL